MIDVIPDQRRHDLMYRGIAAVTRGLSMEDLLPRARVSALRIALEVCPSGGGDGFRRFRYRGMTLLPSHRERIRVLIEQCEREMCTGADPFSDRPHPAA